MLGTILGPGMQQGNQERKILIVDREWGPGLGVLSLWKVYVGKTD